MRRTGEGARVGRRGAEARRARRGGVAVVACAQQRETVGPVSIRRACSARPAGPPRPLTLPVSAYSCACVSQVGAAGSILTGRLLRRGRRR